MKDYIQFKARHHGDTLKQFEQFKLECSKGTKIQLHGADFVAVDRKSWNEIIDKLSDRKIFIGSATES